MDLMNYENEMFSDFKCIMLINFYWDLMKYVNKTLMRSSQLESLD